MFRFLNVSEDQRKINQVCMGVFPVQGSDVWLTLTTTIAEQSLTITATFTRCLIFKRFFFGPEREDINLVYMGDTV